jgi:Mce-associated membrane protein
VTTPHEPDHPQPEEPLPADLPPSLLDRLAELEPEDDEDDLFDYDDEDDLSPATAAPEGEVTSYDDSSFAAVGAASAPVEEPAPPAAVEPAVGSPGPEEDDTTLLHPVHETAIAEPEHPAVEAALAPLDGPEHGEHATEVLPTDAGGEEAGAASAPPAEEQIPAEAVAKRRRARRRRISLPVVALLLMTVLMAAATAFLWLKVNEKDRTEDARRAGLEASRDAARLLFSYDYRTLDKDFSTGRALTTGEFRSQYDKTTTKVVADVAKQYKAVVKANVVSAGVVRATPSTVVTVVYVNQVTTSTRVTGEKVDLSRVRMTLQRSGGRWLVTAVNAL